MIDAIGRHVLVLRNRPLFNEFFNKRTHDNTEYMFRLLAPFLNEISTVSWTDMANIMVEANTLALHMYSGPYEFRFVYPQSNHYFDPSYMVDHFARPGETMEMQRSKVGLPVKLAITAVPLFRNAHLEPTSKLHILHLGDVLLASPPGESRNV